MADMTDPTALLAAALADYWTKTDPEPHDHAQAAAILATAPGKALLDLARQGQHVPALVEALRLHMPHRDINDHPCSCVPGYVATNGGFHSAVCMTGFRALAAAKEASDAR